MESYSIRLKYQGTTKRFQIESIKLSFQELKDLAVLFFPELSGQIFQFTYYDDVQERIEVASDMEITEAIKIMEKYIGSSYSTFHISFRE
jgi:hypothetical protein